MIYADFRFTQVLTLRVSTGDTSYILILIYVILQSFVHFPVAFRDCWVCYLVSFKQIRPFFVSFMCFSFFSCLWSLPEIMSIAGPIRCRPFASQLTFTLVWG